ncbi:hypothetical protein KIN20_016513 [Parelaphostrongylus tenuis]|uniref:Uncharacterized protein n=1 Tax=Parelaphostrongylus tenuis TaxID=148309 RepID=A0AAD5MK52_PARTN|nr:hypothetical protein KIN20_016513 [Parelaphostrongylus tenuis]
MVSTEKKYEIFTCRLSEKLSLIGSTGVVMAWTWRRTLLASLTLDNCLWECLGLMLDYQRKASTAKNHINNH